MAMGKRRATPSLLLRLVVSNANVIRYNFVAAGNRSLNAPCALASAPLRTVSPSALNAGPPFGHFSPRIALLRLQERRERRARLLLAVQSAYPRVRPWRLARYGPQLDDDEVATDDVEDRGGSGWRAVHRPTDRIRAVGTCPRDRAPVGAMRSGRRSSASKFRGPRWHRVIEGAGHNLPEEAPSDFADVAWELASATCS